jgi:LuxR family transcriptional regulator, maltose regulon positive regulatory protein
MPILILQTKLYPPLPTEGYVSRQRLIEGVRAGVNGRVTIISAPPGFGKTTLVSAWLATNKELKVAWYSLDEDDNEPGRFFAYVAASLRPLEPDSVPALDSRLGTGSAKPRELTAALLNDLAEFSSKSVVLIFDDYHHITQQPIHDALVYLIDHLPNNIHLVFISRADPPLPLGRWRVRGQLTEIRADDLRFTEEEAAQFLNQTMGLTLTAEDIHTLESRTEGWVAGLQLAALSLQKSANPSEVISAFAGSNRYVAEYLTDEVLSRQSEALRDFLLKTSILERFNASLCDHVLEASNSDSMLAELERANLFIIPLDSESNWFRYHHLFADLLRRRLAQANQNEIANLHHCAAEWFEKNNFLLDAVRHWIAANEPERVASLMEHALNQTWGQVEMAGLMKRVETLPEAVLAEYPSLSAFWAWSWFWLGYDNEKILPLLERAEKNLQGKPNADHSIGRFNVIRSYLRRAVNTDSPSALLLGRTALEQLAEEDLLWRGFAELNIAACTHSMGSDLAQVEQAYSETVRLCQMAGDFTTAWIAACVQVQVVTERGDLGRAIALNTQLLDGVRRKGSTNNVRGWAHINQAGLMYQVNELEAAWRETNITIELEKQTGGVPDVELRLFGLLTKLELLNGNENAARNAASELIARMKRSGVTNAMDRANSIYAELMFRLGDWHAFDAWAQTYRPPPQPLFLPYRLATLMYARYLMRQKAWDESRRLLEEQARLGREAGHVEYEMEIGIVRSMLEKEAGRSSESMQALTQALGIGAAGGYVRVFVDEGEAMKNLLAQAQRSTKDEALRAYITKLLAAFEKSIAVDQSSLIEPLTEREIEVLKLIAEGCSNPEIAEKLVLSVGTVKTHVKHIYGKLGVDDRVKAASMARELGLMN